MHIIELPVRLLLAIIRAKLLRHRVSYHIIAEILRDRNYRYIIDISLIPSLPDFPSHVRDMSNIEVNTILERQKCSRIDFYVMETAIHHRD